VHYWNQLVARHVIDPRTLGWSPELWTTFCASAFTALALDGVSERPSAAAAKRVYDIQSDINEVLDFPKLWSLVNQLHALIDDGVEKRGLAKHSIVACSLEFFQELPSLAFLKMVKSRYPSVTTVVGGRYDSETAESIVECFPFVDICVYDEGQRAFLSLCEQMPDFKRLEDVSGIVYRKGRGHHTTAPSTPMTDLEDDFADYSGFDWEAVDVARAGSHTLSLWDSRDCWWSRCSFCIRSGADGHARYRSAGSVLREVSEFLGDNAEISNNDVNIFLLGPESIGKDPQRFTDILRGLSQLRESGKMLSVTAIVSPIRLDSEMVRLVDHLHGRLILGFERWDSVLASMNKPHRIEHGIQAIKMLVRHPNVNFNFPILIGHPGETLTEIEDMVSNLWCLRFLLQGSTFTFNVTPIETYRNSVLGRACNFDSPEIRELYENAAVTQLLALLGGGVKAATAFTARRFPLPNRNETGILNAATRMLREVETRIGAGDRNLSVTMHDNDLLVLHIREDAVCRDLELPAHPTVRILNETEWIVTERSLRSSLSDHEGTTVERIFCALEENGLLFHDRERHTLINTLPLSTQRQCSHMVKS
jgi:tRNA A37 methylthiotransferase MiaB